MMVKNQFNKIRKSYIWLYVCVSIGSFIVVFGIYLSKFGINGISNDQLFWSYLGDYLGGVLTPILTIVTIAVLLHTLKMQIEELELQREELKLTREEFRGQTALLYQNQFLNTYYKIIERIISIQQEDDYIDKSHSLDNQIKLINQNKPKKTKSSDVPKVYNRIMIFILILKLMLNNKTIIDYNFYYSYLFAQVNDKTKEILLGCGLIDKLTEENSRLISEFINQQH